MSTRIGGIVAAVIIILASVPAPALSAWETPGGVSGELRDLHVLVLWACAGVVAVVYAAMIRAIVKASPSSRPAGPGQRSHRTAAEVMWTVAAAAIMVAMAVPAAWGLVRHEGGTELTVHVTGHPARWHYAYPEHGVSFYAAGAAAAEEPMVVPVNARVRLLVSSPSQAQAWWVPDLGVKEDVAPGRIAETAFVARREGLYHGRCPEGGVISSCAPVAVKVTSRVEYRRWLASRHEDLLSRLD